MRRSRTHRRDVEAAFAPTLVNVDTATLTVANTATRQRAAVGRSVDAFSDMRMRSVLGGAVANIRAHLAVLRVYRVDGDDRGLVQDGHLVYLRVAWQR